MAETKNFDVDFFATQFYKIIGQNWILYTADVPKDPRGEIFNVEF